MVLVDSRERPHERWEGKHSGRHLFRGIRFAVIAVTPSGAPRAAELNEPGLELIGESGIDKFLGAQSEVNRIKECRGHAPAGVTLEQAGITSRRRSLVVIVERGLVTGTGTQVIKGTGYLPRIAFHTLLRGLFADKKSAEEKLRASGLDWTIVYPVLLTNGPLTERYRVGERLKLHGMPRISRADVAHFILNQAQSGAFVRKIA